MSYKSCDMQTPRCATYHREILLFASALHGDVNGLIGTTKLATQGSVFVVRLPGTEGEVATTTPQDSLTNTF